MEAQPELPKDGLEALRRVVQSADELRSALNESNEVTIPGSDFELAFRALEEALAALPEWETEDKENWGSLADDWRLDAPGG